jgi:signal transduction histidine kinase
VKIAVVDRGCGIKPDDMQRVFESFYTTKSTGLGVGLALCRTIIEDHGGQLGLETNADGGTSFAFTLRTAQLNSGEGRVQT